MVSLMTERDMTLKKLSELSGISRPTLSQIKSGKACTLATATAIANAFGLSVYEIEVKPYAN